MSGYAGLIALVPATRIYPGVRPQGSILPAVSYFKVTNRHLYRHRGAGGWAEPRFQIDVWASTYASAKRVAEQVRLGMNAFTGTFSGVEVGRSEAANETDLYEPETQIHHIALDFDVTHKEAVA